MTPTKSYQQGRRGALPVKHIFAAAGACSLILGLTTTPAGASTMRPALSGTLTMNVFTFTTPVIQPVIAAFEKLNPGVHIQAANVVNTPSTYIPLLQTERLAGNEPMIDETYDVLTPTLEVDGLLGDLSPDLKTGKPYPQNYWLKTFEASYIPPKGPRSASVRCSLWLTRPMPRSSCTTRTSSKKRAYLSRKTGGRGRICSPMPRS